VSEDQRKRKQTDRYRGNNPIHALWTQSGSFHTAWFKNGESLSNLQREPGIPFFPCFLPRLGYI
jgi:hypothetical protein